MPVTREFARAIAELALDLGKPVSTLVDRRGRVRTVAVGESDELPLPERHGEADSRLYGYRLIHTHRKPKGLGSNDLTKLFLNRLDAIIAVDISESETGSVVLGDVHLAQIAPPTSQEEDWIIEPPMSVGEAEQLNILEMIRALEQEMARSEQAREVKRSSTERAVLVGLNTGETTFASNSRLDELVELARTAGATVAYKSKQKRDAVDPKTLIGRGKIDEILSKAYHEDADMLIFDRELNPRQAREIEDATQLKVIDRTQLILDIFAQNAKGREAQVQVELAQLHYQATRLIGHGSAMSRIGGGGGSGGIGTRGPGETKLELDRRRIRDRISALEKEVETISSRRMESRKTRTKSRTPVIALVGYTNAGKSTLFNAISKGNVLSANKLFATLRPTTREGWLPDMAEWGAKVLYTDTVGFIRDLPKELVNAFRATLEELHDADLLLHVVDGSSPDIADKVKAVNRIMDELELEVPRLVVLNKADLADADMLRQYTLRYEALAVSAVSKEGLPELKLALANLLEGKEVGVLPQVAEADITVDLRVPEYQQVN